MALRARTGGGLLVAAKVDDDASPVLRKAARRELGRHVKTGLRRAAERAVLPSARRRAVQHAGAAGAALIVRSRASSAYLTCRSARQGRIVGLLNFGGTVRTPIRPKKGQAVVVNGQPVAQVTTPRVYHGAHFLERSVAETFPAFERILLTEVLKAFDPMQHQP
jgi:hypothetical protein